MLKRTSFLILAFVFALPRVALAGEPTRPKVYVLLIDGLPASALSEETTPNLLALAKSERATRWTDARAAMPSVTNTNHTSLLTGVYAAAHGITGNYFWSREDGSGPEPLDRPEAILVETLFTIAEREQPELATAAVVGKAKLERLFAGAERQRAPDHHWSDEALPDLPTEGRFGTDERTMREALRVLEAGAPDFLFVALPEVDLVSHVFGPGSPEARRAITAADREIGRFVGRLRTRGLWERSVVFVTADHGFADLTPGKTNPHPPVFFGRDLERAGLEDHAVVVTDGLVAHIYLRDLPANATALEGAALEAARRVFNVARKQKEIDAVLTRLPWTGPEAAPPLPLPSEWQLSHPRAGDLLLVAEPGHHFVNPASPRQLGLLGQHGGPEERRVPMIVAGGHPVLRAGAARLAERAENPDIGATALRLLGLPAPRDRDGQPVPAPLRGRILDEALTLTDVPRP